MMVGMDANLPPPRRWFRFSLRTMFVLVTFVNCHGAVSANSEIVPYRDWTVEVEGKRYGLRQYDPVTPMTLLEFGDHFIRLPVSAIVAVGSIVLIGLTICVGFPLVIWRLVGRLRRVNPDRPPH
jgi:hypothetical protein